MIAFLCVPLVIPGEYVPVALAIATFAFVMPFTESGVLHNAFVDSSAIWRRMALCGRPFRGPRSDASGSSSYCSSSIR